MMQENKGHTPFKPGVSQREVGQLRAFCKQWLFMLSAVVLFFGGLEVILALMGINPILSTEDPLVGFAGNIPLFIEEQRDDGQVILKTALNKLRHFNFQVFPKNKATNSYRIFCVGGSTTYGRPYEDRVSFCGWLRAFLSAADPSRNWEVINAGGVSYASYRVAKLMNELVQYQPDLFVVYSGQNEFLEQRSYGRMAELPYWMIQTDAVLNGTRVYSAMKGMVDALQPSAQQQSEKSPELSAEVDDILRHTVGPTSYHRDDALKQRILTHYRINLDRMAGLAREAGAEVVFINPAVNLKDMSPFKSEHADGLDDKALSSWNELFQQAKTLHKAGYLAMALKAYRKAQMIDDRYAELHFNVGQTLLGLERYAEAEASFWRAIDEDVAPLRMLSPMQDILSKAASENAVPLVDFSQILRQAYRQQYDYTVFGKEFFLDHVHTNAKGYRLLGLALFDQLVKQGIARPGDTWGEQSIARVTSHVNASLDRGALDRALLQLAKVLGWAGKFDEMHELLIQHLKLFGPQANIYAHLGQNSQRKGNATEAIYYFRQALALGLEKAWIHRQLGDVLKMQGNTREAIKEYLAELRLDNNNPVSHDKVGVLLLEQGDIEAALGHFREALRVRPDFKEAQENLQKAQAMLGQGNAASLP